MSKTFLSDIIAAAGGDIRGEMRKRIEYLPITQIYGDERNFYSMTEIQELADNIKLVGLLDPIVVREDADRQGVYFIISGHRRRAALWLLYEENPEEYGMIMCIVQRKEESEHMEMLRLILANMNTREMSDSDKSRQTQELFGIFRELKAEGMELPGSLRKYVAEAANISETKAATLKVIREKLNPVLLNRFDSGDLSTEVAYIFAKADEKTQAEIAYKIGHVKDLGNITIVRAEDLVESVKSGMAEGMVSPAPKKPEGLIDFDALDYIAHIREEDRNLIELLRGKYRYLFSRYGYDGVTRNECIEGLKKRWKNAGHTDGEWNVDGSPRGVVFKSPFTGEQISRTYTELWDLLAIACIASMAYEDCGDEDEEEMVQPTFEWQTGTPYTEGLYAVKIDIGEKRPLIRIMKWSCADWHFPATGGVLLEEPVGWYKIPEV